MGSSSRQRGLGWMLPSSFMELLEAEKTAQPQEQDPKDDLLGHRRTQVATIGPKPRRQRRWLRLKDESHYSKADNGNAETQDGDGALPARKPPLLKLRRAGEVIGQRSEDRA